MARIGSEENINGQVVGLLENDGDVAPQISTVLTVHRTARRTDVSPPIAHRASTRGAGGTLGNAFKIAVSAWALGCAGTARLS